MSDAMTDAYRMEKEAREEADRHSEMIRTNPYYRKLAEKLVEYDSHIQYYKRMVKTTRDAMDLIVKKEISNANATGKTKRKR